MNSFELNKILGAILGCCLITLALNIGAGAIFSQHQPEKPGYAIAAKEESAGGEAAKKEPEKPIAELLAHASAEKGQATAKQCQACHTFEKGGPNRVGPNLYDIVGHERGTGRNGFNFSQAMKSKGGKWTYEELNKFLTNPRGYIPGTNMTFAGLSRDSQRADVIAYLRTLSDNPQPMPAPTAENKPADNQQGGDKPAESKPADNQQGGNKPAENKPADNKPAEPAKQ
jgi:cytochrome c